MIFWVIREACIRYGTVVNIVRAHLSRHKIVHLLGSFVDPISVDVTDNSEHWATDAAAYVKVNCDATMLKTNVGWIVRDLIVILFSLKNLNILFVKRSENKAAICLARFLFLNQVVIDSSRVCLGWVSVIY